MNAANHIKNRRKHFFIDKPFQFRYGLYIGLTLLIVCSVSAIGLYFGIWSSVIKSFSDEEIRGSLETASRMQEYQAAREPAAGQNIPASLRLFKEVTLLSARQREIINEILMRSNKQLLWQVALLVVSIGIGSIYLTNQIAGPFYRLRKSFEEIEKGNLALRIHFRKHDEAVKVAEEFNRMIASLDDSIRNLKKIVKETKDEHLKSRLESELSKFNTTEN